MVAGYPLPPPKTSQGVQVATLITMICEEAREVLSTFTGWTMREMKQKFPQF